MQLRLSPCHTNPFSSYGTIIEVTIAVLDVQGRGCSQRILRPANSSSSNAKAPYSAVQTSIPRAKTVSASDIAPPRAAYAIALSTDIPRRILFIPSRSTRRDTKNVNIAILLREVTLIEKVSNAFIDSDPGLGELSGPYECVFLSRLDRHKNHITRAALTAAKHKRRADKE